MVHENRKKARTRSDTPQTRRAQLQQARDCAVQQALSGATLGELEATWCDSELGIDPKTLRGWVRNVT